MLAVVDAIVVALLAFVPAMIANSLAVVFGGGYPIDAGKEWGENRLLGDGKTWYGLFGGTFSAALVGAVIFFISRPFYSIYPYGYRTVTIPLALSFGALLGDIIASFIKRRSGKERGAKTPFIDQYDFILGGFFLVYIFAPEWTYSTYLHGKGLIGTLVILIATPLLHRGVNIIGYKLGLKDEPW